MTENLAYDESRYTTSFSNDQNTPEDEVKKKEEIDHDVVDVDVNESSRPPVTIITSEGIPAPYAGMPKEVLLHYSRQKRYVWARNILTGLVILTILTLLAMVIALIAVSPACQHFWQASPIYQIYPKSFRDSNNDGVGDLRGVIEKIGYLKEVGVSTIWLNPIYLSPQVDNGYDIEDYRSIDPRFGSMEDLETLITELHKEGMKLIMDFVPNHSSDQHEWFLASSDPTHVDYEKYRDYYVWADGTPDDYPNNWQSVFSKEGEESAWEWNEDRKQYYYHAFFKEQPDLNFRNPAVLDELKSILEFWLDKGVDGFRIDAIGYMYEATHLRDNPLKDPTQNKTYENVYPDYTEDQKGIHDIIADWRKLLDRYSSEPGVYRFMETEVYDTVDVVVRYYGTPYVKEADFPMNFRLIDLGNGSQWSAQSVNKTIMEWMTKMPSGKWPNWVIGNHDNSRVVTRLGEGKARLAAVLTMSLSGTPGMYYGEEIGMTDGDREINDFRDPERTPMQWDASENAGFCSNCTPWLYVNDNYETLNVEAQQESDSEETMLCLYQKLIQMRSELIFTRGSLCILEPQNNVFMFVRELPGSTRSTLVAINFGNSRATVNIKQEHPENLPDTGTKYFQSGTCNSVDIGADLRSLVLEPEEAIMVEFKPPKASALFSKTQSISGRCFTSSKVCVNVLGILEVC